MGLRDLFRRRPAPAPASTRSTPAPRRPWQNRGRRTSYRGWDAADTGRLFQGWGASGASADEEVRLRQYLERGRARELQRTNPWAVRYFRLMRTNVFGEGGIRLVPRVIDTQARANERPRQVPDREANDRIRNAWLAWGKLGECTVDGRHSWKDVQHLIGVSYKRDGEVFIRMHRGARFGRFGFRIQLLEGDHCLTTLNRDLGGGRQIKMGIERDEYDRPVAYWLARQHPGDNSIRFFQANAESVRIPTDEIIHFYDPVRIGQSRGLPALESGMAALHMLGGYEEAELVAARVAASKMGWLKSVTGGEYTGEGEEGEGSTLTETEVHEKLEPGSIDQLPKDVEFQGFDPQHPNSAYEAFVKGQLRRFGAAAGVSYNGLSGDLEGVNFSSLREGRLSDRDMWKLDQEDFQERVGDPIYDAWLPQAILSGEIDLPWQRLERYRAHRWQPRRWDWIDPLKEAQAKEVELDNMTTSLTEIVQNRGRELRELFEEIQAEIELAEEFGLEDYLPYSQPRRNAGPAAPPQEGE